MRLPFWELTPEQRLMLDIVLRRETAVPEPIDWDAFDAGVRKHRLQPLLIRGLRSMDRQTVEQYPALKRYLGMQNKYTRESFQRLQALTQANNALAQAGIRMIAMKGPLLAIEAYGDPSLRTSRDLDVMVPEADLEPAGEILAGLGYEPEENPFHKTPLRRKFYGIVDLEKHMICQKGDICLELHWKSNAQTEDSFDDQWMRREEQMILGKRIAVLGTDDRYPALIVHAAEHGFHRLRWLLDLYELQKKPTFSWERVYRQMRAQNLGELLLETLIVLYRMQLPGLQDLSFGGVELVQEADGIFLRLEDRLAEEGRRAIALSEAAYPLWHRECVWGDPRQKAYDRLLPVSLIRKTPVQKLLLACGPSRYELELVDLPDWLFWAYFLIRPLAWLWRRGKRK
jgi:hypothetical protein